MFLKKDDDKNCFICHRIITGSFFYDHLGNYSCAEHEISICFSCRGLCDLKQSINIQGYGYICPTCAKKSISTEEAIKLVTYVQQYYRRMGLSFPGHKLHLVSLKEMNIRARGRATLGLAYQKTRGVYRVCILKNLSKIAFAGVFAHEILHLWQYGMKLNPPEHICEGFCNLGEYIILSSINKEEAKLRMEDGLANDDPIYGRGLRRMKVLYDTIGWQGVVDEMMKYK